MLFARTLVYVICVDFTKTSCVSVSQTLWMCMDSCYTLYDVQNLININ